MDQETEKTAFIQFEEGSDWVSVVVESARSVSASNILVYTTLELENQ